VKPYHDGDGITIYNADCREVMAELSAVDAIVCDPPYGLSFMGKGWDHGVPGEPFWSVALRCAKPGAHLVAFGGTRTFHRLTCAIEDAGWEIRDCLMWVYGSGFPKSHNLDGDWSGWGTALKPAWEPIILARKPLEGTVAQNVLKYGTGALNIDGCRVGKESTRRPLGSVSMWGTDAGAAIGGSDSGRWPANLIHDGSQQVLELFPESTSGAPRVPTGSRKRQSGFAMTDGSGGHGDSGSAARFFYCAKASRAERGDGNHHPTVKPLALMRYLITLVTPPGGTVLDPFMGSGSTLAAAAQLGHPAIGCDTERDYCEIAARRSSHARTNP